MMASAIIVLLSGIAAYAMTRFLLNSWLVHRLLDVPNSRSSHSVPTPRGGGLAVVGAFLFGIAALTVLSSLTKLEALAFAVGGTAVAAVGFVDDLISVRARWRLVVQLTAGIAVAMILGLPTRVQFGDVSVSLSEPIAFAIVVFGVVWTINLFNFMDGIDGIAVSQTIIASIGAAVVLGLRGQNGLAIVSMLLASASAGFGIWNWPPAKIFMGDVCSGFLGLVFATLALGSSRAGTLDLIPWLLLLFPFFFDAGVTLIRRTARWEPIFEPHRKHAYQRAVQSGYSHAQVTSAFAVGCVACACLAILAVKEPGAAGVALLLALIGAVGGYVFVERRNPMR